jgi:glycosyltransferase involved in cell wall biosynthesis
LDRKKLKLFIVVSEDWSFWSHRLSLAESAIDAGFDVTVLTKVNELEEKIKGKGINVININFVRSSKSPITDLLNIIKLFSIFRKEKPDLIHNVALKTILIGSLAALFNRKSVVVNAFTGLGYVFSSNQLQAKIIRLFIKPVFHLIIRRSNYWTIFQNPDDSNLFNGLGLIEPERSVIIRGSGVDTNDFLQVTDTNNTPVVMLASRMLWDKGVGEFVEAAKRLRDENSDAKFILVGDADTDNPMSIPVSTIKQWTNEGYVRWEGHSNNMPETLASASIVCLPSYREGLPKVLLEAAAVSRPLIATDVPGCREIVKNGENGILVKLKDVDSLYNAIKMLISNNEMRKAMGRQSRMLVESELSTEIINKQTLELYKSARNNGPV